MPRKCLVDLRICELRLELLMFVFNAESIGERILKIAQYLAKLWARVEFTVFFDSRIRCHLYFVAVTTVSRTRSYDAR